MSKTSFTVIFGLTADPIHKGHEQAIINGIEFCRDNGIGIEQFLLIPVYQPNLIADKKLPVASFEQRFSMCQLVASRLSTRLDCDIQVSQIEKELVDDSGEKNYSYNTIRALNSGSNDLREWIPASAGMTGGGMGMTERRTGISARGTGMMEIERKMERGENCLFMVSADHFQGRWPKFRKWFKWQELLECSGLLINQRPGHKINESFIHQLKAINPNIFVVHNTKTIDVSSSVIRNDINLYSINELLADDVVQYIKAIGIYR